MRTTPSQKHTSQIVSRSKVITAFQQALNKTQEKVSFSYIESFITKKTLSSPGIVRNIAEKIYKGKLGNHYVRQFIHRHLLYLKDLYIRNIKNLQKKTKYTPIFQLFYNPV